MKTKHHIAIVDDDADDREIIRDAFVSATDGKEYVFLENGEQLMHYLLGQQESSLPSLIMLDLNMPGMDGRETLKEIKKDQRYAHIPTIVFTTSSSPRDRMTSYGLGANLFVTKPDTFGTLVDIARSISKLWLQ